MERISIDDDFKDWLIGHLPLHMIARLHTIYRQEQGVNFFASFSEIPLCDLPDGVFDHELKKMEEYLDNYKF